MKNLVLFAATSLFLSTSVLAEVFVLQDGKVATYRQGVVVTVSGKTASRVLYDGVLITVPQGQKVSVSKKGGKILVSGTNLKGIEIAGETISSKGQATVSVSPDTMKVSTVKGNTIIIKPVSGTKNNPNVKQIVAANVIGGQTAGSPEIFDYVNEVAVQQSARDVIENPDLSQSAPRY